MAAVTFAHIGNLLYWYSPQDNIVVHNFCASNECGIGNGIAW
jgi:hypothetical protein